MSEPATTATPPRRRDDLSVTVAGQGGDGSLTIIALLAGALARHGLHLYRSSNIASRIKGGHAAATLRASATRRGALGDSVQILVAFDQEAVEKAGSNLAADGVVIFDSSRGALPPDQLPEGTRLIPVPFSRFAVRDLRRELFKNAIGFALLARVIGLPDDEIADGLRDRFQQGSRRTLEMNLRALDLGLEYADSIGLTANAAVFELPRLPRVARALLNGNEAMALGFIAAGGQFFAGYPITPATTLFEFLQQHLDGDGGIAMQAEDELAAINLAIGASLTGARAMVASSGPGIALMQEGIGHCGAAEIPLVIVDCQRAGPSTGMPTKPEQSDIDMLVHGANGDFPRVVLCPGNPEECFSLAALATNLAQRLQGPVLLAADVIASDATSVDRIDLDAITIEPGARLDAGALAARPEYRRYAFNADGISPWVAPGTAGGMHLVTGNERDEWGRVSTDPVNRQRMMDKRARKIAAVRAALPGALESGPPEAALGILSIGSVGAVVEEACARLQRDHGIEVRRHRPRTLWPVLDDTLAFTQRHARVIVVEQNESGQLLRLLRSAGAPALRAIRKYDGQHLRPADIVTAVLQLEEAP